MSEEIQALNERFGAPGRVNFHAGPGGLIQVAVSGTAATAAICLQGAHLTTWGRHGEPPVVWLSPDARFAPGKSIRGGVPVCWPWFGPHETEARFPAHGFARTVPWAVEAVDAGDADVTRLEFRLVGDSASRAMWPHACELRLEVAVGAALEMALVTRNTGAEPITIGQALHTYFEVSDVRNVRVEGLEDCPYLDKVEGMARKRQSGPVTFDREVDRIYLDHPADCRIVDPGHARAIRIRKSGSASTVLWNPWIEKAAHMGDLGPDGHLRMVCVESANAAGDVVRIAPGVAHRMAVRYEVEAL